MICLHYPRWGFQREAVVTHCSLTSRDPPPPPPRDLSHTNGGPPRPAQAWSAWVQLRPSLFRVACGTDRIRGQKQSVGIFSDPTLGRGCHMCSLTRVHPASILSPLRPTLIFTLCSFMDPSLHTLLCVPDLLSTPLPPFHGSSALLFTVSPVFAT